MKHRPLVFIDIETTGSSANGSRILEIGALRVEDNQVVRKYKQILNPEEPIPPFITNLTGIAADDVWGQPRFRDVASEVEELFADAIFVAHNVSFDYSFVKTEFAKLGVKFSRDRLCTVRLSRALYPEQRSHRLDEVIRVHGYNVLNRHRAYDDAEVLWKFYFDHLQKHGDDLYRIMNRLLSYSR